MPDIKGPKAAPAPTPAPAKAADKPVYKPVVIEYDEDATKSLKSGAPQEPSPLLEVVQRAYDTGKAQGVGYGEEYKKNTVLAHIRKAWGQITVAEGKALRTYDRSDYVGADGKAWPHIGFKVVDKPAPKAKPGETVATPAADATPEPAPTA